MATKLYLTSKFKHGREAADMSQQEFAQLFGLQIDRNISISLVQKWEQGSRPVNPRVMLEISRFLKIDLDDLVVRK